MRWWVLLSWAVLFGTHLLWWGWWVETLPVPRAIPILLFAGPLLLPLHGLLQRKPRAYFWFNLLLMPYFCAAVAALYASGGTHPVAGVQLVAILVGFVTAFRASKAA